MSMSFTEGPLQVTLSLQLSGEFCERTESSRPSLANLHLWVSVLEVCHGAIFIFPIYIYLYLCFSLCCLSTLFCIRFGAWLQGTPLDSRLNRKNRGRFMQGEILGHLSLKLTEDRERERACVTKSSVTKLFDYRLGGQVVLNDSYCPSPLLVLHAVRLNSDGLTGANCFLFSSGCCHFEQDCLLYGLVSALFIWFQCVWNRTGNLF